MIIKVCIHGQMMNEQTFKQKLHFPEHSKGLVISLWTAGSSIHTPPCCIFIRMVLPQSLIQINPSPPLFISALPLSMLRSVSSASVAGKPQSWKGSEQEEGIRRKWRGGISPLRVKPLIWELPQVTAAVLLITHFYSTPLAPLRFQTQLQESNSC